jgi:hypothetical protein
MQAGGFNADKDIGGKNPLINTQEFFLLIHGGYYNKL